MWASGLSDRHLWRQSWRELSFNGVLIPDGHVHTEWSWDAPRGFMTAQHAGAQFRAYLRETEAMLESDQVFEVLAHLDYPKRYWPAEAPYDPRDFEAELRTVLRAAARRGTVLEVNTTRGGE